MKSLIFSKFKYNKNILFRVYEHRRNSNETLRIGLFHRCENRLLNGVLNNNKIYLICDNNKYLPYNKNLTSLMNKVPWSDVQRACNIAGNPYNCDYTSVTKTLIASTIICVSTLSLSIISIYLHLLINQFKFKTHLGIAIITISLLFIAFIFNLITLILLSSTMSNDLYEYRYNFNYRLIGQSRLKCFENKTFSYFFLNLLFRTSKFFY